MSEIINTIKTFIATIIIIMLLQIKVGDRTIENISYNWIQKSSVTGWLQGVAAGGVIVIQKAGKKSGEYLASSFGKGKEKAQEMKVKIKQEFEETAEATKAELTK
jgi:hypothetical protein